MIYIKIIHPVADPIIDCYPNYGAFLSILQTNETAKPWIVSNFVQLECPNDMEQNTRMDFYMGSPYFISICPWILLQRIRKDMIQLKWSNDISLFVREALLQGYYVFLMADQFFIPASSAYQKFHRIHELFIYGFDDIEEMFYISDNFQNGKYSRGICSFTDLNHSYIDLTKATDLGQELIYLLSFNNSGKFSINLDILKELLSDYLHSINSSQKNNLLNQPLKREWIYGLGCYDHLIHYLKNIVPKGTRLDIRPFYVLINHKTMMIERLICLSQIQLLKDPDTYISSYTRIEELTTIALNLSLKYTFSKKANILTSIAKKLEQLSGMEADILPQLIKSLS